MAVAMQLQSPQEQLHNLKRKFEGGDHSAMPGWKRQKVLDGKLRAAPLVGCAEGDVCSMAWESQQVESNERKRGLPGGCPEQCRKRSRTGTNAELQKKRELLRLRERTRPAFARYCYHY